MTNATGRGKVAMGSIATLGQIPLFDAFNCIPRTVVTRHGTPYRRWEALGMPRLGLYANLLRSVFFLYRSRAAAEEGEGQGGSGILLTVPSERFPEFKYCFGITNWHVACRDGYSVVRVNRLDGKCDVFEFDPTDWYFEADGPDLAAIPLVLKRETHDLVALDAIPWSISEAEMKELEINVGDDVFMVGRFIDYDGIETNLASMRFGNISILAAPIKQPTGYAGSSTVIDMHSRSGYSGSPVFVYRTTGGTFNYYDPERLSEAKITLGHLMKFLGIHWGQFPEDWELRSNADLTEASLITDGAYVRGLSGMTCVIPSSQILRLLDMPELKKKRKAYDDELEADLKKRGKQTPIAESTSVPKTDAVLRRMLNTPPQPRKKEDD